VVVLSIATTVIGTVTILTVFMLADEAFAQEAAKQVIGEQMLGAAIAFGLAALGAGLGLGYVGAAALAAISENPKIQSRVFIFIGMVESIAIYGLVVVFIILGQ
jgi:V/A-type H+-transporting ATPase subunit K